MPKAINALTVDFKEGVRLYVRRVGHSPSGVQTELQVRFGPLIKLDSTVKLLMEPLLFQLLETYLQKTSVSS